MQVNDPSELAYAPVLRSELEFEEPRDYHEFFWDDQPMPGENRLSGNEGIHSKVTCIFDSAGNHVYMSDTCPHFNLEDQEGRTISKGWTVQHGS